MKIGHGYDVHRLKAGRPLILGGVKVESLYGLDGHSDADVLLHAIMDAVLGALGDGDIGMLFPDTDPAYEGVSSVLLCNTVAGLMHQRGFTISNLDCTIIAQAPKLAPYRDAMRRSVADAFSVPSDCINIKATTEEGLGFTGRREGIACHAVVLLCPLESAERNK